MSKIITTIGPSSIERATLIDLKKAGATDFRVNLSHSNSDLLEKYFKEIMQCGLQPAIDTQGPQLRTTITPRDSYFHTDQQFYLSASTTQLTPVSSTVQINHSEFFKFVQLGDLVRIDFDGLIGRITEIDEAQNIARCVTTSSGPALPNKAIDIVGRSIELESLTDFDVYAIRNYAMHSSSIYISFTQSAKDIRRVRELLDELNGDVKPLIVAKIESRIGLANLEEIINDADAILIDRGDLSREISISRIPIACRAILNSAKRLSTPCYIATDILSSMIKNPLPTRSEISDLYSLYLNGASGIVLAAEVAIGNYPIECVQVVQYMYKLYLAEKNGTHWFLPDDHLNKNLSESLSSWM